MVLNGLLSEAEHEYARLLLLAVVAGGAGLVGGPVEESVAGDVKPRGSGR
jgi:hypothetical protein